VALILLGKDRYDEQWWTQSLVCNYHKHDHHSRLSANRDKLIQTLPHVGWRTRRVYLYNWYNYLTFHLVSSCLNPLLSRFIVFRFRMAMTPKPGVHSVPRPPAWSLSDLGVTCCEESARPNVVPMTHRSPVTHLYPLGDLGDPLSLTAQNITMPYPDLIPDGSRWSDGTEWYISNH